MVGPYKTIGTISPHEQYRTYRQFEVSEEKQCYNVHWFQDMLPMEVNGHINETADGIEWAHNFELLPIALSGPIQKHWHCSLAARVGPFKNIGSFP